MKLLVFAGTTEGRLFTIGACKSGFDVTVSVATDYGKDLIDAGIQSVNILRGRLKHSEIRHIVGMFDYVIDATHPYAAEITLNVSKACNETNTKYIRLLRKNTFLPENKVKRFKSLNLLCEQLKNSSGNIFVSTGSKELDCFKTIENYQERLWVRVIPASQSIDKCIECGLKRSHIIAMQGPFSKELNAAMFSFCNAKILVTKESGPEGGYEDKVNAAFDCNMDVYTVERPCEQNNELVFDDTELLLNYLKSQ